MGAPLEDALERPVDACVERAFDHRRLTKCGDLDAWSREGQPLGQPTADRFEQRRVGSDAAAEHDEWKVERRREWHDVRRDAPGCLLDDRHPNRVTGAGRREDLLHVERWLEARLFL